jgi:NADPH2:quinone reductase
MESAPEKMKAVLYTGPGEIEYSADTRAVTKPGPGQVLIKVEASVINPSDLYMMQGNYSGTFTYPLVPGSEGSGTVVASGGGMVAWMMMGKRVGFVRQAEAGGKYTKDGAYAEYVVTTAMQCVTLDDSTSWEQGAGSFVNPITCVGLLDKAKEYKAPAVISTGAASQLGRMIIKYFKENGVETINVVRRKEQVELLQKECGAEHVLDSTDENFDADLKAITKKLGANVCLEAVAGELTGRIM